MVIVFNVGTNMLTTKQAAAILCVHENTLRRWSDAGVIPTLRLGPRGDRRYLETDIRSFFESGHCACKPGDDEPRRSLPAASQRNR